MRSDRAMREDGATRAAGGGYGGVRRWIVVAAVLLLAAPAAASEEVTVHDLRAVVQRALAHSPDLAAARAEIALARARAEESEAGRFGEGSLTALLGAIRSALAAAFSLLRV